MSDDYEIVTEEQETDCHAVLMAPHFYVKSSQVMLGIKPHSHGMRRRSSTLSIRIRRQCERPLSYEPRNDLSAAIITRHVIGMRGSNVFDIHQFDCCQISNEFLANSL
jgi:hypothetical protein